MFERVFFLIVLASVHVYMYPDNEDEERIGRMGEMILKNKLHYTDSRKLIELGEELCEKKEYAAALQFFDRAIEIRPIEESFLARGKFYKQRNKLKLAIADLKRGVRWDHERNFLIEAYIENGDWEEAADVFTMESREVGCLRIAEYHFKTLKLEDHADIVVFASRFCIGAKYREAIRCFNKALIMEPLASYYKWRGTCYVSMKRMEKALDDFQRSVELDANLRASTKVGYERVLLCLALMDMGKFDELVKEIHKLKSKQHVTNVTENLFAQEKFSEAIPCYTAAIEEYPEEKAYYQNRAKCYTRIGDLKNAISDLQRLIELDADSTDLLIDLIGLLIKTQRYEEARDVIRNNAERLEFQSPSKQNWLVRVKKEIYRALEKAMQEKEEDLPPATKG